MDSGEEPTGSAISQPVVPRRPRLPMPAPNVVAFPPPSAQSLPAPLVSGETSSTLAGGKQKESKVGSFLALTSTALISALLGGLIGGVVVSNNAGEVASAVPAEIIYANDSADANTAPPAAEVSIVSIAAKVGPAVVKVQAQGGGGSGSGTGFVIRSDGYILTNHHVVSSAIESGTMWVQFPDGERVDASLVGSSPEYDIAVLRVAKTALPAVTLGNSDKVQVGEMAVAFGSPLGLAGTVTAGIVSAVNRPVRTSSDTGEGSYLDAIQTDAPINPGNSGGPLVNGAGQIIGVNTAIATFAGNGDQRGSIGVGFAIPINAASRVASEIIATGKATITVLGVTVDNSFDGNGARVLEVNPNGPANNGGVLPGDVVLEINGVRILDGTSLVVVVRSQDPGTKVPVVLLRDGKEIVLEIELGFRP